ncbi:hypothetical protein pb186bvf_009757 [Paramecium bursaria]
MKKQRKTDNIYLYAAALQDHMSRKLITLPKLKHNGLSLAQKLGLVPSPPKPISQQDWEEIENKAKSRNIQACVCPICLESFKHQEHIILNCSHIYHKQCLESFEKISKQKQCPICRKQDYEKKKYLLANEQFKLQSIIKIQKYYKGYKQRIRFFEMLCDMNYKPQAHLFKRKLLCYKLVRVSRRMQINLMNQTQKAQQAVDKLSSNYQQKLEQMQNNLEQIRILKQQNLEEKQQIIPQQLTKIVDWQVVRQKIITRKEFDCTICFQNMINTKVYILSCSHIFHAKYKYDQILAVQIHLRDINYLSIILVQFVDNNTKNSTATTNDLYIIYDSYQE